MRRVMLFAVCLLCCALAAAETTHTQRSALKAPPTKRLNNLVQELLKPTDLDKERYVFSQPNDGWMYLQVEASEGDASGLHIYIDDQRAHGRERQNVLEVMRTLAAGRHVVTIQRKGDATLKCLVVRSIPELQHAVYGYSPQRWGFPRNGCYGPYDWDFLDRTLLDSCNVVVSYSDSWLDHLAYTDPVRWHPYSDQWRRLGRRWVTYGSVGKTGRTMTAEQVYRLWLKDGFSDSASDGFIVSEFGSSRQTRKDYAVWTQAIRMMKADPQLADKMFYPYVFSYGHRLPECRDFLETVVNNHYKIACEFYAPTPRTLKAASETIASRFVKPMLAWREQFGGSQRHMVAVVRFFNLPPEVSGVYPEVDFKVSLDMIFHAMATNPAFKDLYGIQAYISGYMDEELIRWQRELFRHYGINGSTRRLTRDPYILPHVRNGDFDDATAGWKVKPAEPGSMAVKQMQNLGWLQGRYLRNKPNMGSHFMAMRRSAAKPNVLVQHVKALAPGRMYSLRMYSALGDAFARSKDELSVHALSIALQGATVIEERSVDLPFQSIHTSRETSIAGDAKVPTFNYHYRLFRAGDKPVKLVISDWQATDDPGGPVGQELMINFVQIAPYLQADGR